jgi:predicted dehydrogenase/threonine dehydrogenase-like Zn-dependent dehydrogenase
MLVDFGKGSIISKARQQPEKVVAAIEKVRTDGLFATIEAVRSKLDQPIALGYCNAGIVLEVGTGVTGFSVGDRVISNGPHAEVVLVAKNLCARIPTGVADISAVFTVLAAIGLQGVRLAQPTLGELAVVVGLGPVGLLTLQILRANGCEVIGIDPEPSRLALAEKLGATGVSVESGIDPVAVALSLSRGRGVDFVVVTASTKSSDPIAQAAQMCRKRGRIVLVGVTGLELNRADFYEKELSFQVSCSYGPGRYDDSYELGGQDYPVGFVRWTEQRNFEAVLALFVDGRIDTAPLISHRYAIDDAAIAYARLAEDRRALAIVLDYPPYSRDVLLGRSVRLGAAVRSLTASGLPTVGVVGAGNYASRVLIPALQKTGALLDTVVTVGGVSAVHHGRKGGFAWASTQVSDVVENDRINTVFVVTRHDTHAGLASRALRNGKHVFVEKPLALSLEQLAEIEDVLKSRVTGDDQPSLMVGFNRRFAPLAVKLKSLLAGTVVPKAFVYTFNAGEIPANHWTQDQQVGGGRIAGEACHCIDFLRFLAGAAIVKSEIVTLGSPQQECSRDTAVIALRFADGSVGSVNYFANGSKAFPKERIEVFAGSAVLQLDNFRVLRGYGWSGFERMRLWRQDKGQEACIAGFVNAIRDGGAPLIPVDELLEVSRVTIELANQ